MHVHVSYVAAIFSKEVSEGNKDILKIESSIAQCLKSLGSLIRPEFDLPLSKLLLIPQFPQLSKGENNTCLIG